MMTCGAAAERTGRSVDICVALRFCTSSKRIKSSKRDVQHFLLIMASHNVT